MNDFAVGAVELLRSIRARRHKEQRGYGLMMNPPQLSDQRPTKNIVAVFVAAEDGSRREEACHVFVYLEDLIVGSLPPPPTTYKDRPLAR